MSTLKVLFCIYTITTFINQCAGHACEPSNNIAKGNKDEHIYNAFTFISRQDWNANPWRNDICSCTENITNEMIPLSNPYIITIHHTAIPTQSFVTNESVSKIQSIQNYHQYTHDWCDIAYNFLIDSAGNIFQGRPFWDDNETQVFPLNITNKWPNPRLIQGSHSLNSNENNIGIAVLGCYDNNSTFCPNGTDTIRRYDSTYIRLVQLISWLCGYYNINPSNTTIVRHSYWKNTECPGNILGSKHEFNNIIKDVGMSVNDGSGLCYDYGSLLSGNYYNNTGGICANSQLCDRGSVIFTGDNDQCMRLGQICCKVSSNNNSGGESKKDWGSVYILIAIVIILIVFVLIGYLWKKRNEFLLRHTSNTFSELAEHIPIDSPTQDTSDKNIIA